MCLKSKDNRNVTFAIPIAGFMFMSFFFGYLFLGYKENIKDYLFFSELFFASTYILMLLVWGRNRFAYQKSSFLIVVFLYSFLLALLLRFLFVSCTGKFFQDAHDSYEYDDFASTSVFKGLSLREHLIAVEEESYKGLNVDDYGFTGIVFIIYSIFGVNFGRWVLLFFNAICISLSSKYLIKVFKILQFDNSVQAFCVSIFAFFSFFPVTAAVGLKENFFVLFIILFLFHIAKYRKTNHVINLILAIFFVSCTFLFRLPVGVILLISLLLCLIINEKNQKVIMLMSIISLLILILFLGVVFESIFGVSLDVVLTVSENRLGDNSKVGWLIQLLSAFVGPFPNYSRPVQYGIISAFAIQLKCVLNYVVLMSLMRIVRRLDYKYYWLFVCYLMGIVMMSVAAVSLDMRYHVTFFPVAVILIGYGLQNSKLKRIPFSLYCLFLIVTIFAYNNR